MQNKSIFMLCCFLIFLCSSAMAGATPNFSGKLIVGVKETPPFSMKDADGQWQAIGIKLTSIFAVLLTLTGMVAIGFIAVWSILSNLSCALFLILFKMFQIGDEIEIIEPIGGPGLKGRVQDFNIMFTSLVEDATDGSECFVTQVPNNIFSQKTMRRKKGDKTVNLGQHLLSKPVLFS
jgi:hypothetical protein